MYYIYIYTHTLGGKGRAKPVGALPLFRVKNLPKAKQATNDFFFFFLIF